MGHAIVHVVANRSQSIQELPVATDQNRVRHRCCINRQVAKDAISPIDPLVVQLEAPVAVAALGP